MKFGLAVVFIAVLLLNSPEPKPDRTRPCSRSKIFFVQRIVAWSTPFAPEGFFYKSGLAIDADGAYRAYHPDDRLGLDSLVHAGYPGNWWALATDNGKRSGRPVVQGNSDPAPGYYVSTTALCDPDNPNSRDPHKYVDAASVPYVVLHPKALRYARLGDFATVVNLHNGRISPALVADSSASNLPLGKGSIALARALGVDASPRDGGEDEGIAYLIYPGSGNGRPQPLQNIVIKSKQLFDAWGGFRKLRACLADE